MFFRNFYDALIKQIVMVQPTDILDILIISVLLYKGLKFIRDTRTQQLLKGVIVLVFATQVSQFVGLHTLNYLLSSAMQLGMIAVIVVFQPELRQALERVGRTSFGKWLGLEKKNEDIEKQKIIAEVKDSCASMSKSRIGALIVIERESKLGEVIKTGINISSKVSSQLLVNIFIPKTPLHDGAVVIRENKIEAASCFLPLSQNPDVSKQLGTRHRAGLGMSEESDAVVVIVSEETGGISIACGGELFMKLTPEELEAQLMDLLEVNKPVENIKTKLFARKEKTK